MDQIGDRRFLEIPGTDTIELPPLLYNKTTPILKPERVFAGAKEIARSELMPEYSLYGAGGDLEESVLNLATGLVERYKLFTRLVKLGQNILEWATECEVEFERLKALHGLLSTKVWPHAGRASLITLLSDKNFRPFPEADLSVAVGLGLNFRQIPPITYMSNHFLMYLSPTIANSSYAAWSSKNPPPIHDLPPERFTFQIHVM